MVWLTIEDVCALQWHLRMQLENESLKLCLLSQGSAAAPNDPAHRPTTILMVLAWQNCVPQLTIGDSLGRICRQRAHAPLRLRLLGLQVIAILFVLLLLLAAALAAAAAF